MAKHIEDEIVYHYDLYPTEEDWMGQSSVHGRLIRYLVDVLTWLFWGQRCALYDSLNFYQTPDIYEYPMSPDIAVIKGVDDIDVTSWRVNQDGPPQVVFEILSAKTWKADLHEKPSHYARLGVQEYFAYDPNTPRLDRKASSRLSGWQLEPLTRQMQPMSLLPNGSLWSVHLDSFLVPGGKRLYLADGQGHRRLTQAQAEKRRADAEAQARQAEQRRADAEAQAREREQRRADAEAQARQVEQRRADAEATRADAEARRAAALAEKLRSLGIDPDQL